MKEVKINYLSWAGLTNKSIQVLDSKKLIQNQQYKIILIITKAFLYQKWKKYNRTHPTTLEAPGKSTIILEVNSCLMKIKMEVLCLITS